MNLRSMSNRDDNESNRTVNEALLKKTQKEPLETKYPNIPNVSTTLPKRSLQMMSAQQLAAYISPKLEEYDIPESVANTISEETVTGKIFKRLDERFVEDIFDGLSRVQRLMLLRLRDDIIKDEEESTDDFTPEIPSLVDSEHLNQATGIGNFHETFHRFDTGLKPTATYVKNAILTTFNTRPSNLLDPVHVFVYSNKEKGLYEFIGREITEFVAASLNDRTNGTLHLGIKPKSSDYHIEGEVIGLQIDKERCLKHIYDELGDRFYTDQIPIVMKCVRPPRFIAVQTAEPTMSGNLCVIEVDVIPQSTIVADEAFFLKQRKNKQGPVLYMFKENGIKPHCVSSDESVAYMSKNKQRLSETRKQQERNPKKIIPREDLRQKVLNLLSSGEERLSLAVCPLLFLSPIDSLPGRNLDFLEHLDFIMDLDASAIFDFDCSTGDTLLDFFEKEKEQVLKAFTTDDFDPNSQENFQKKDRYSNILEEMKTSVLTPWIFCNGYIPLSKTTMNIIDWKQKRSKGFKEAIRFYSTEIPKGRGKVVFCLFSKEYEVMLSAAEEVLLNFQGQWVVFAECEEIANHWCKELVKRHVATEAVITSRTVVGMPWRHVSQTIKQLVGLKRTYGCEIPTSTGAFCHLKEKKKNELFDLEILSRNECDNYETIRHKAELGMTRRYEEERFYNGGTVAWLNFWFENHVLERDIHKKLLEKVIIALEGKREEEGINKIGIVNIYHQPGAGGTTTARHILWDLKEKYRCCIVKQISDPAQTVDQISAFRKYDETDDPKPALVLIENRDEEKVVEMLAVLQNRARIVARHNTDMKVFCVILLCSRKTNIPSPDNTSEVLRHELSERELQWFSTKYRDLEKQHKENDGPDPRFLISFNILKANFDLDFINRCASELVDGVTDQNERLLLKYLSFLNMYDLEMQAIPISAFDPIMGYFHTTEGNVERSKKLNKSWEQTMSQPLQILLNRNVRAGFGSQLYGLSIVSSVFAKAIFSCFVNPPKLSEIVIEFLKCPIFSCKNMSCREVERVVKNLMKKREIKEETGKEKFSPLVMDLVSKENAEVAAAVLIKTFEMTDDPMIAQQISRLYIHYKNWKLAIQYAKLATDLRPTNSFLWDTYGQVYKNWLDQNYLEFVQRGEGVSTSEIEFTIKIAQKGIEKFKQTQKVSETEHSHHKVNNNGYYGELQVIVLLLDTLRCSSLGHRENDLHAYLINKNYIPESTSDFTAESTDFLKSLEKQTDVTMKKIEDKTTQLKSEIIASISKPELDSRIVLVKLRENIDTYFGEDFNHVPDQYTESEKAEFRRRRVKRLGGRTLYNFLRVEKKDSLKVILDLLLDNVKSDICQIFDIVSLINTVIAMKIFNLPQTKVSYENLVSLSIMCYEKVTSSEGNRTAIYLEAFMYFVLFNWPTNTRQIDKICPADQLQEAMKNWKDAFLTNYPRQKEDRPVRQKETTIFFMGKGREMEAIVHNEEFVDEKGRKLAHGDDFWEYEDFVNKVLHLPGILVDDGRNICYNVELERGGTSRIYVPTSFPIKDKSLWQKRIYFVLGFGWSGPIAYDVRRDQVQNPLPSHTIQSGGYQSSNRKQPLTHESFITQLIDIRRQLESLKDKKKSHKKDKREEELKERKKKLLEARGELFGTKE